MNIKEHIDAGHYPVDKKGRALVPMKCGRTATILATDKPGEREIVGWVPSTARAAAMIDCWDPLTLDLLPPPPRKVVRWAALSHEQLDALGMYDSDGPAQREVGGGKFLTKIEYEVKR